MHENYHIEYRFQNFILFEPASLRIDDTDILVRGEGVRDVFNQTVEALSMNDTLENLIIHNRLNKIGKMLDLVSDYNHVIISKFFDRIWRRYSYLSNLGESFLDLKTHYEIFGREQTPESLMATRFDASDEDEDGGIPDSVASSDVKDEA